MDPGGKQTRVKSWLNHLPRVSPFILPPWSAVRVKRDDTQAKHLAQHLMIRGYSVNTKYRFLLHFPTILLMLSVPPRSPSLEFRSDTHL